MWIPSMGNHGVARGISEGRRRRPSCSSSDICITSRTLKSQTTSYNYFGPLSEVAWLASINKCLEYSTSCITASSGIYLTELHHFKWFLVGFVICGNWWVNTLRLKRCMAFCRWHSQMHFLFKLAFWFEILLQFVPRGPSDNMAALVQVKAWHWKSNKPLPKPMMTQFTDTCMPHQPTMS